MRRAVAFLAVAALGLVAAEAPRAQQSAPERINAIGLIDYGAPPTFKVGDYARYHMSAQSALGVIDDYNVTVLIAGEEEWWGERCFWVETWTTSPKTGDQTAVSLMSYDIFADSLALPHMQLYVRKIVNGLKEDGSADQLVYKRPASTLKSRDPIGSAFKLQVDTLGTDTTTVPKGTFACTKLRFLQGRGATGAKGDSTDYTELREQRTTYMSAQVPITHIVREDIDQSFTRKAWKVGHSKDATPTMLLDRTLGSAQLIEYGTGLQSRLLPPSMRRSIAETRAAERKPTPKPRPAGAKRPG
jgi:hypothetical protein